MVSIEDQRKRELRKLKKAAPCPQCGRRESAADLLDQAQYWDALGKSGRQLAIAEGAETLIVRVRDRRAQRTAFIKGRVDIQTLERAMTLAGITAPGGTLVDVGAGVGAQAVAAIQRGLFERVIAVEPDPENFRVLAANIALNDLGDRITAVRAALGSAPGARLGLAMSRKTPGDSRTVPLDDSASDTDVAETLTLDAVAPSLEGGRDLIHVDVNGYEGKVLEGGTKALASGAAAVLHFSPREVARYGAIDAIQAAVTARGGWFDLGQPEPDKQSGGYLRDLYQGAVDADAGSAMEILLP